IRRAWTTGASAVRARDTAAPAGYCRGVRRRIVCGPDPQYRKPAARDCVSMRGRFASAIGAALIGLGAPRPRARGDCIGRARVVRAVRYDAAWVLAARGTWRGVRSVGARAIER